MRHHRGLLRHHRASARRGTAPEERGPLSRLGQRSPGGHLRGGRDGTVRLLQRRGRRVAGSPTRGRLAGFGPPGGSRARRAGMVPCPRSGRRARQRVPPPSTGWEGPPGPGARLRASRSGWCGHRPRRRDRGRHREPLPPDAARPGVAHRLHRHAGRERRARDRAPTHQQHPGSGHRPRPGTRGPEAAPGGRPLRPGHGAPGRRRHDPGAGRCTGGRSWAHADREATGELCGVCPGADRGAALRRGEPGHPLAAPRRHRGGHRRDQEPRRAGGLGLRRRDRAGDREPGHQRGQGDDSREAVARSPSRSGGALPGWRAST